MATLFCQTKDGYIRVTKILTTSIECLGNDTKMRIKWHQNDMKMILKMTLEWHQNDPKNDAKNGTRMTWKWHENDIHFPKASRPIAPSQQIFRWFPIIC